MKALLLVLLLFLPAPVWSQSQNAPKPVPPITDKTKGASETKDNSDSKQTISIELPASVNVIVGGKLDIKGNDNASKAQEPATNWAEWLIAGCTGLLVIVTGYLARYTKLLWVSTKTAADDARNTADQQRLDMQTSLTIAKQSADSSTRNAEVAIVSSMPVLSPWIVGGMLYPFKNTAELLYSSDEPKTFTSTIYFVFENFGKTPGIIREVRGDLFLCEMDQFPIVDLSQLPVIDYQPIVAGDSRRNEFKMAVAEYEKPHDDYPSGVYGTAQPR